MAEFETMIEGDDGWCDWIHPIPGYRLKCCDCGLVHRMEFEIVPRTDDGALNPGEDDDHVIVFRASREDAPAPLNEGHRQMLTEREQMIVDWLRQESARWRARTASYRAMGNSGPYLGSPNYGDIANRIEAGEHLKAP